MEHGHHAHQDLTIDAKAFGIIDIRTSGARRICWRLEMSATTSPGRFSALSECARRCRFSDGRTPRGTSGPKSRLPMSQPMWIGSSGRANCGDVPVQDKLVSEHGGHGQLNLTIDADTFGIIDIRICGVEGLRASTCVTRRPWIATQVRCFLATSSPAYPGWVCHDGGRGIPVPH